MDSDAHQKILVHAGATANRHDDQRYRHQAQNYAQLDSAQWTRITCDQAGDAVTISRPQDRKSGFDHDKMPHMSSTDPQQRYTLLDDTQLAYTELTSQLPLSSAPARLMSGRKSTLRPRPITSAGSARIPYSATKRRQSLDRQLSQSSYLVTPILDRSKRVKLPDGTGLPTNISETHEKMAQPDEPAQRRTFEIQPGPRAHSEEQPRVETLDTNESTSELPTSYSLSDGNSGGSKIRAQLSNRSSSDPGPQLTDLVNGSIEQANASPVKERLSRARAHSLSKNRDDGGSGKGRQLIVVLSQGDIATLQALPLEIRPPVPEVSIAQFATHVTQQLAHLASESSAANCFTPTSVAREIQIWDRGHWRLDCSTWPVSRRVSFWNILQRAIESGSAGYDTWATRGSDNKCSDVAYASNSHSNESPAESPFGVLRIYCWGEIVRHIFILLYVASCSKVRQLGAQWLDAGRQVVVQMPSEGQRR